MSPNNFKIVFGNEHNEVDIETLIGCLMHTSNIIQEVNRSLETDKKIEVRIKALEKGSFEVHIELVEKLLRTLFSSESVTYGASIITIVGGLYKFANFLKGKKPQKIESKGGSIEVTNANGDITIVQNNVYNIFNENKSIRESIVKQFSTLKQNKDIENFSFEGQGISTTVSRCEFEDISTKIEVETGDIPQSTSEIVTDKSILIVRPSFTPELKWDFVYEGQRISAKMSDQEMIRIIDLGEKFAKGDTMLVDIEITKYYDTELQTYMITKDSYKILKYKQHIKAPQQNKLF